MIKRNIITALFLCFGLLSMAQTNIREVIKEVISNNLSIQALTIENQMNVLRNKGEMIPDDPEISYGYLWGTPTFIGNKTAVNANQKIKFPTYYFKKKKLNNLYDDLYDRQLEMVTNQVLYETLDILIDQTYLSERKSFLSERLLRMKQISELADKKFIEGEANRIEMEKAHLLVDTYKQDLLLINTREKILHNRLLRLNAYQSITIEKPQYADFDALLTTDKSTEVLKDNPAVEIAEINTRLAETGIELAKTDLLPDIIMGYASEAINREKLAGVVMGVSLPLWGKTNSIKKAKLQKELYDKQLNLTSQMLQNEWDNNDEMARQSLIVRDNLQAALSSLKAKYLLEQSWRLGEISLLDYLKELPFFYNVEDRLVEAWKQYYKSQLNKNKNHLKDMILSNIV